MNHSEEDAAKPSSKNAAKPSSKIPLIKIKLPKMEEAAAKEEAAAAAAEAAAEEVKSKHYCKECKREFSSGKALGGHMSSAHVQANKDYSFKKMSSKKKQSGSYSGSISNTCMMCQREFQSKKSLFGHMRTHPERDWRGMKPPPGYKIHSSGEASSEDDDQTDGLGFNLKSWPTSNKRGRGPLFNSAAVRAPDSGSESKGSESFVAGLQLIKLLKGDSRKQENGPSNPDLEQPRRREETASDEIGSDGKGKEKLPENQDSDSGIDPNDELYITAIQVLVSGGKRDCSSNEKRVAAVEEKPPAEIVSPSPNPSPEKYKCNECGRLFTTHQALGGHRSSHRKFKITIINTNEIGDSNAETQVKKKRKKKEKTVKGAGGGGGGGFAFDLNRVPAEEEEEVEGESSNDHSTAASLSNS